VPSNEALQVFYGTIPLILVIAGFHFRKRMLLKGILKQLGAIETRLTSIPEKLGQSRERLVALE
jgi:hypothetical protein